MLVLLRFRMGLPGIGRGSAHQPRMRVVVESVWFQLERDIAEYTVEQCHLKTLGGGIPPIAPVRIDPLLDVEIRERQLIQNCYSLAKIRLRKTERGSELSCEKFCG